MEQSVDVGGALLLLASRAGVWRTPPFRTHGRDPLALALLADLAVAAPGSARGEGVDQASEGEPVEVAWGERAGGHARALHGEVDGEGPRLGALPAHHLRRVGKEGEHPRRGRFDPDLTLNDLSCGRGLPHGSSPRLRPRA